MKEAEEVVAPAVAAESALGKDGEEGASSLLPNTRRVTPRKRSAGGGITSGDGLLSKRSRSTRSRKEAEAIVSAAEEEQVEVPEGGIMGEGDSSLGRDSRGQDVSRKRSSSARSSAAGSPSMRLRRKRKKAGKEIVVPAVDEAASDEEDLEVEEDEVGFEEDGDDVEIEEGEEVMDPGRKRRVVIARKSAEDEEADCRFIGQPIEEEEAKRQWPKRYQGKAKVKEKNDLIFASLASFVYSCLLD